MQRIVKGSLVYIATGKDKGKTGAVEKVFVKSQKALVSGLNIAKKGVKASSRTPKGGIITKMMPLHISNLLPICPSCQKPVRIRIKLIEDKKTRVCAKCGKEIDVNKKDK